MKENFKYYEIDNRKFKVERIDTFDYKTKTESTMYELTVFENDKFIGSYCFHGNNAYGECLAEILSYSEISDEDYQAG